MCDIKTVHMNVVALRIAVRQEPISARSQTVRLKEMALFNRAVSTNALETLQTNIHNHHVAIHNHHSELDARDYYGQRRPFLGGDTGNLQTPEI